MKLEMEEICAQCDATSNVECDDEEFFAHKAGRWICPECGAVNLPCNECVEHWECGHCPYANAKIINERSAT